MLSYVYWVLTGRGPFRRELEAVIEDARQSTVTSTP